MKDMNLRLGPGFPAPKFNVGDWVSFAGHTLYFIGYQAEYPFQGINGAMANVGATAKVTEAPAWKDDILNRRVIGQMWMGMR